MSGGFATGEQEWRAHLGTLRQVVRQEVVARQLAAHLPERPSRRVLDIGCGQGTQALLLARRGHSVTGLDASARLLGDFRAALAAEPAEVGDRVRLVQGEAEAVGRLFSPSSFDAVLCQGVLMYFADPGPLLDAIARVAAPGAVVSLLVRNGDALALRPGLLGDWDSVGAAFDGGSYRNRIGVDARADRLADLTAALAARRLPVRQWYGVRVFTDIAASDAPLPGPATLDAILRHEERAGRTDPYRHVAALLHLIAVRADEGVAEIYLYSYNRYMSTSNRRPWLILCICCMSLLVVGTDVTIVNVALPAIGRGLHASLSGLQWSVDAYTLVIGSLLMASGSMGDRFGRRRVFQTGLAVFTAGSLLCSLAPSVTTLIAFRALQALGGSMLNPVALSIVSNTFTERRARARALGIWAAVFGLSLALGPVVGGFLVSDVSWRAIFWINIPIGIAAIVLTQLFVPESKAATARRFDPWGQLLVISLLATLTYGVIEGPGRGWASPVIVAMFAAAAASAVALILVESRRRQPLLEVRFFRSVPFSGASVIALLAFAVLAGFLFLNTLYLQDGRGYSALRAGLMTLPMAVMICLFAPVSGRLVGTRGPRLPLVLAGLAMTVAAGLMLRLSGGTPAGFLLAVYVLFGLAFGLVNAPIANTAISGMPDSQAGVAASVASASRQTGSALGVAVTGSLVAGAPGAGLASASHAAWALLAACGLAVAAVGYVSTGRRALATADGVREILAEEAPGVNRGTATAREARARGTAVEGR